MSNGSTSNNDKSFEEIVSLKVVSSYVAAFLSAFLVFSEWSLAAESNPSFNCSKATTKDEIAICDSTALSQLDRKVAFGFKYVKQLYGISTARNLGRLILKNRRRCGSEFSCIAEVQRRAIKTYQSYGASIVASRFSLFDDRRSQTKAYTKRPVPENTDQYVQTTSELIELWREENGNCRGGAGNSASTIAACSAREAYGKILAQRDYCYGLEGQAGFELYWRRCKTAVRALAKGKPAQLKSKIPAMVDKERIFQIRTSNSLLLVDPARKLLDRLNGVGAEFFSNKSQYTISKTIEYLVPKAKKGEDIATIAIAAAFLSNGKKKYINKALEIYTNSAKKGSNLSQFILGLLYLVGGEVAQDEDLSNMWLYIAAMQDGSAAVKAQKILTENMSSLDVYTLRKLAIQTAEDQGITLPMKTVVNTEQQMKANEIPQLWANEISSLCIKMFPTDKVNQNSCARAAARP